MRAVSKKRAKVLRERKKLTDAMKREGPVMCGIFTYLAGNPYFDAGVNCYRRADDAHELVSRARGGSITDRENIVPLCREHHRYVTEHPAWAEAVGLARRKQ